MRRSRRCFWKNILPEEVVFSVYDVTVWTQVLVKTLGLCLLLFLAACFSCSEAALFSLGKVRLARMQQEGRHRSYQYISHLLRDPGRLLVTIIIGNEIVNVVCSTLTASLADTIFARLVPHLSGRQVLTETIIATAFLVPLIVLFGDYLPKTVGVKDPERLAQLLALPLAWFSRIVAPLRWVLETLAGTVIKTTLGSSSAEQGVLSQSYLRTLVDVGSQEGEIAEAERRFIHNIFDFGDTKVSELMTPRTDMLCLDVAQSWESVRSTIADHRFSRLPVYEGDKDNIVGVLYVKDLLAIAPEQIKEKGFALRSILRKPYFIPHSKKADDLFREFQFHRVHMAIVVDEYGGVAGLVTMEDLLEELFGEVLEDYEPEQSILRRIDERTVVVHARMSLEEFNERLEANLPLEEYNTIGGLVFGLFGRLPAVGAQVSYAGFTFTIEKMRGTKLLEIRVCKEIPASPDTAPDE